MDTLRMDPKTSLALTVTQDRDYNSLLAQTKMVYDQLLADKHLKLEAALLSKKQQYDVKCGEIARQNEAQAMEFGVRAQDAVLQLQRQYTTELRALTNDYQNKLNGMQQQLENQWNEDRKGGPKTPTGDPPMSAIPCGHYRHK